MHVGMMDPSGEGTTKAGKICGMIGVILALVGFLLWIFLIFIGITVGVATGSGY